MYGAREHAPDPSRSFWAPFLIGVGIMAGVDEILFHQVLG